MTTQDGRANHGYKDTLVARFTYHPPTPEQPEVYQLVRDLAHLFGILVEAATFPSRERSLAITNAEQAVMWANAAIARRGLSDAAHAGARDLFDLALAELQKAKPDSAVVVPADAPVTDPLSEAQLHAGLIQRARQALIGTGHFTEAQVGIDLAPRITELWSQMNTPDWDTGDDPWPPDGHVHPRLEPLPAARDLDTVLSGVRILTAGHHDPRKGPGDCPGCIAQHVLNGEPVDLTSGELAGEATRDPNEWTGVCPFCPEYIRTEGRGAQRDAQEWVLDHAQQAHGRNLR